MNGRGRRSSVATPEFGSRTSAQTKFVAGGGRRYSTALSDANQSTGVGTPVPGGLTFREGHLICEKEARRRG